MSESSWFEAPSDSSAGEAEDREVVGSVTYLGAVRAALEDELENDSRVILLGEDIGAMGGAFRVTEGLFTRFGGDRVIDTPMSEAAIVGAGIGLAITGWRPIIELQFADFISCAYDQIVTEAAKLHYRFGVEVPLVIRAPSGGGVGAGPFHSQCPEGVFAHIPGLKVVCPGSVQDAYDLLRASVADPNPVLYFEHKALYRGRREPLERRAVTVPLGRATVSRDGTDATLVTYGGMVPRCLDAAERAAGVGIDVEVVDIRTILPLDIEAVLTSATKTGRVIIVHEDTLSSGVGAEIAATLVEHAFFALDTPIRRITAPDSPFPFAPELEAAYLPSVDQIFGAIQDAVRL